MTCLNAAMQSSRDVTYPSTIICYQSVLSSSSYNTRHHHHHHHHHYHHQPYQY